jgi:hypothetical protein
MKITVTKTVTVKENVNTENLKVVRTGSRDIDSIHLELFYNDIEIGYGHLNNRTNFAHITLNEDNQELEDYLVNSIENKTINLI